VELGSGTGAGTVELAARGFDVVALDLSMGMLAHAPASAGVRVRGDSSQLPFRAGAVTTMVLVNMLLFPAEVDRVLASDGAIVWVNTLAEETPIHLPPEEVVAFLPGTWRAIAGRAGTGLWCVARRV
jgi:ubiquinone/menaquinone biosynthesis C-methylase UbiE